MALVYCRECGAKISDKASVCPKCGVEQDVQTAQSFSNDDVEVAQKKSNISNTNKSNNTIMWTILGIVVVFIAIIGCLLYSKLGSNTINGHEYVDLGLPSGIKWATCNIGASEPEEYGDYYAWGETTTKSSYDDYNSKTDGKNFEDISGDQNYDAARANWGKTWRIPTKSEMEELESKCTWTWTSQSGTNGYKVTGPNGNSIFLPTAGYCYPSLKLDGGCSGYYLSSTPTEIGREFAHCITLDCDGRHLVFFTWRSVGCTIRPVSE